MLKLNEEYKLWLVNHDYFHPTYHDTLEAAIKAAKALCMDIAIYHGNKIAATVGVIEGTTVYENKESK